MNERWIYSLIVSVLGKKCHGRCWQKFDIKEWSIIISLLLAKGRAVGFSKKIERSFRGKQQKYSGNEKKKKESVGKKVYELTLFIL